PRSGLGPGTYREVLHPIEREAGDSGGVCRDESQHAACALRHAEQRHTGEPEMTAQRREVERIVPGRGHPARLPMTSAIETHQAEGAAERVDLRVPHGEIERPAVHEHDRRTLSLVTIAQAGAVGAGVTGGGTSARE